MATANPVSSKPSSRRRWPWLVLAGLLLALVWFWRPLNSYAMTGAAYGARVACSCHYLGGRSLNDCHKDFEPGMELVILSADREAKTVTARFPLLATQTAAYYEGQGCKLQPWDQ